MGGVAGGGRGGASNAVVRPLTTWMRGGGDSLEGVSWSWGMLCLRMLPRCSRWSRAVVLSCWGMRPLISSESLCAAATTRSAGVTVGWVIYLCLWKTVAETRVERVSGIHMVKALQWSKEVPRTKPLLQCSANVRRRFGLSWTRVSMPTGTKGAAL